MISYRPTGNPRNPLIVLLHGFLGSSADFIPIMESLQDEFYCIAPDLPAHGSSAYIPDTVSAISKLLANLPVCTAIIGYSLGGRIATRLAHLSKHLLLFSAHLGLSCPKAIECRREEDALWAHRLLSLPPSEFLSLWYAQSVFSSLHKKYSLLERLLRTRTYTDGVSLSKMLLEHSLAKQPLFTPTPSTHLFFGEKDLRYKTLYTPLGAQPITNSGHTVFLENPQECLFHIKNVLA